MVGAAVPFVLRRTAEEGSFRLVGEAYVYDVMGEVRRMEMGDSDGKVITII